MTSFEEEKTILKNRLCFGPSARLLYLLGVWPIENEPKTKLFYWRYYIPRLQLFRYIYTIIFSLISTYIVWGEVSKMIEYSTTAMFYIGCIIRTRTVSFHKESVKKIILNLGSIYDQTLFSTEKLKRIARETESLSRLYVKSTWMMTFLFCFISLPSLVVVGFTKGIIPFRLWLPYDYSSSPIFEITLLTIHLLVIPDMISLVFPVMLYITFNIHLIGQYKILQYNLENIRIQLEPNTNSSENENVRGYTNVAKAGNQMIFHDDPEENNADDNKRGVEGALWEQEKGVFGLEVSEVHEEDNDLNIEYQVHHAGTLLDGDRARLARMTKSILNEIEEPTREGLVGCIEQSHQGRRLSTGMSFGEQVGVRECGKSVVDVEEIDADNDPDLVTAEYLNGTRLYNHRGNRFTSVTEFISHELEAREEHKTLVTTVPNKSRIRQRWGQIREQMGLVRFIPNKINQDMEESMKSCVIQHHTIISLTRDVQRVFKVILWLQVFGTAVTGLLALYITTLAPEMDTKVLVFIITLFGANGEFLAMCWFGNELTVESEKLREAVYGCEWYGASESFKRSIRIMISRTNKPEVIKAGGLPLSVKSFRFMIRTTYYLHRVLVKIIHGVKINEKIV